MQKRDCWAQGACLGQEFWSLPSNVDPRHYPKASCAFRVLLKEGQDTK